MFPYISLSSFIHLTARNHSDNLVSFTVPALITLKKACEQRESIQHVDNLIKNFAKKFMAVSRDFSRIACTDYGSIIRRLLKDFSWVIVRDCAPLMMGK